MKKIIHIDMDCFYAAIEMRDQPKLANQAVAVGGDSSQRGVLCTCNYIARQYGLHSAMPTYQAMRLCPDLVLLPVNFAKYRAVSSAINEIFRQYSDRVETLSLDEAYLDVSNNKQFNGSATLIANDIRRRIYAEHHLTASAGVSVNKLLAKIASDWRKPNGLYVIEPKHIERFILSLPISKLSGVGRVTAKKLTDRGVQTCADLQNFSLLQLTQLFGKFGARLYQYCRGIDLREVETSSVRKSVSVEHTFSDDLFAPDACSLMLTELYDSLLQRLRKYSSRHINKGFIKIKFNDFTVTTVERGLQGLDFNHFAELLKQGLTRSQKPVRLLGIGVRLADDIPRTDDFMFSDKRLDNSPGYLY